MARNEEMESEVTTWHRESRMDRLDRCRKYLYGEQVITSTVNDAIRSSLEEARDRALIADADEMAKSAFEPEEKEPEKEE